MSQDARFRGRVAFEVIKLVRFSEFFPFMMGADLNNILFHDFDVLIDPRDHNADSVLSKIRCLICNSWI